MTRRSAQARCLILAATYALVATAAPCAAVTIDFEPPAYTPGDLIGQDGWVKNAYYGTLNGTVSVSTTSPLAGAQSLSYAQTVAGGFSDISKNDAILIAPGVQGTDLTVSYVIKGTTNSLGGPIGGIFLGANTAGGSSPIFGRINGGVFEVGANLAVDPVNEFFFAEGERLKVTYEVDFDASNMNLILENLDFGDVYSQSFPFFAGYGAPSGPNGEFVVDVGVFLRGGNIQIDDIMLTAGVGPLLTDFTWNATGSGNWNQTTNWDPPGIPGTVAGRQHATLGAADAPTTIYNNSARVLNSLEIDSAQPYFLAGAGSLGFQSDTSGPTTIEPSINVAAGSHQIQLPIELIDDTTITVVAGGTLDLNNQVDLNGNTLDVSGTVRINHSTVGGGTVASSGALAASGAVSIGGNLVSSGELLVGVDAEGADSFIVAGDATLSGVVDVDWSPAAAPAGELTILTAAGTLDASGLALDPQDARSFALGMKGNSLTLTFLGAAVPEPAALVLFTVGLLGVALPRCRRRLPGMLAGMLAACLVGSAGQSALAAAIDFENPPYTAGALIGQDGWVRNAYITPAALNGDVTISSASPLVGSQSLLYSQTSVPVGFGGSDVSKPSVAFAVADGSPAIDLTATVRLQADANASGNGQLGFFLSGSAFGGLSPIGVRLNGANSATSAGGIGVLHTTGWVEPAAYTANNVVEFQFGVNFDNGGDYEVAIRDVTAGQVAFTPLVGPLGDGRFGFFNAPNVFPSDGDGVTYTVDVGTLLRGGDGRIDAITVVGDDFVQAVWGGGSGDWSTNNLWIPQMIPNAPTGNGQIAIFGDRATSPQTVFTNTTQTVNGLRFDNANKYVVGGGGAVALKANTIGGTVNPTINVVTGSHELQVPVSLLNNTTVTVDAGAALDFNNTVALGGNTLTTSGAVNLNVGVTGGGAINNSGTLGTAGTTPLVANLTSTGTLQIDLGPTNTDFFNITGSATLSGVLDVALEPGFTPVGPYTVLTASGGLNAAGLALHSSDTSSFTLGVLGNSLVLTVGGTTTIPGDFNNDGLVNATDLAQWRGDFGVDDDSNADGDMDSDGNDFLVWQRNLGQTSVAPAAAAVPEPATAALIVTSLLALASLKRGVRRR